MSPLASAGLIVAAIVGLLVVAARIGRRHVCTSETRISVSRSLFPSREERHLGRTMAFMVLSITIAVMGISADSAAVVIGAMLLAPFAQPLMGLALATTMGWLERLTYAFGVTLMLTVLGLGSAVVLAAIIPDIGLTDELLARTSPDLRDLAVALAAGGAGAYATIRNDVSATLPGVAIAVALVPPLASAGIALHLGRQSLAAGAMLLYAANLVAIVLASIVVILGIGFVPQRRLRDASPRVVLASVSLIVGCALISVPLVSRTVQLSSDAAIRRDINAEVERWLDAGEGLDLVDLTLDLPTVELELAGATEPPPPSLLASNLAPIIGGDARVDIIFSSRSSGAAADETEDEGGFDEDDVRLVIEQWADELASEADLLSLDVLGWTVAVQLAGVGDPPSAIALADRLDTELGHPAEVALSWTQRQAQQAATGDLPPEPEPGELARVAADEWAMVEGLTIVELSYSTIQAPDRMTVLLRGATAPDAEQLDRLEAAVERAVGADVEVIARFSSVLALPVPPPEPDLEAQVIDSMYATVEALGVTVVSVRADEERRTVTLVTTDERPEILVRNAAEGASDGWSVTLTLVARSIETTTTTTTEP
ncbi:MAG: DUF389 domain-containing protein [Actinomycetota bacterium]